LTAPGVYEKQILRCSPNLAFGSRCRSASRGQVAAISATLSLGVAGCGSRHPYYDRTLGDAFVRNPELFFDSSCAKTTASSIC
jgi:hypothetical protein